VSTLLPTTGTRVEASGAAAVGASALMQYMSWSEIASAVAAVSGIIILICGRIYSIRDERRKERQAELTAKLTQAKIDRELCELQLLRDDMKEFRKRKERPDDIDSIIPMV